MMNISTPDITAPILSVRDLSLEFKTRSGTVKALDHVSLEISKGQTVGLVGESGSGKSVLSYAILGLLDKAANITSGEAIFGGLNLFTTKDINDIRGRELSMIFQNPKAALNPIRPIGKQLEDVLKRHQAILGSNMKARAIAALAEVKIPDPERRYHAYPFELSGGMCQRVMIALALASRPALLIADEPTTGLDVTTQASVMTLISDLAKERNMATLLITHDLHLAAQVCDRIVVMHAGQVVEGAETVAMFQQPKHPYTTQLIRSTPQGEGQLSDLASIAGAIPDLRRTDLPECRFSERCEKVTATCKAALPFVKDYASQFVRCHHA
jgi:peptide/nickel transport system ATP-binding protein